MAKLSNPEGPRVPRHAVADIVNQEKTIQVNHCRNPACANYGVRPRTMPGRTGPSAERDPHYRLHSTNRGLVPALLCKSCGEIPPVKSNDGIAAEIARLIETDGWWTLEERTACKNPDCRNVGHSVARHPREYTRRGHSSSGGQVYKCRSCGRTVVASTAPRVRRRNRGRAADVLSRLANKAPKNGIVRGAGLSSSSDYYSILNYIHDRCQAHSAAFDRAMIDGRIRLPEFMAIEADAQSYMLNWTSRFDRRNVEIFGYCSVDGASRYILGLHGNYDAAANAFDVNTESARTGQMSMKEAYRKHAHYWLVGDDLRAGRSKNFATKSVRKGLAGQIEMLYAASASRADVEDIELEHMDTTFRTPFLKDGLLVHMPYTTYAHWYLLRRLLTGAGVQRTQFHFDIDSMSRAGFLCTFIQEIKERRSHAFYVKYDKNLTIDERRAVVGAARSVRRRERKLFDPEDHDDIDMILMKRSLTAGRPLREVGRRVVRAPEPEHGRAAQGNVVDHPGRPPRRGHRCRDVPALRDRPRRQRVPVDAAAVQRPGEADRDAERPERRLARLPALQPDHDPEVPDDLPGGQQLHPGRHGRQDPRHAARAHGPADELCANGGGGTACAAAGAGGAAKCNSAAAAAFRGRPRNPRGGRDR